LSAALKNNEEFLSQKSLAKVRDLRPTFASETGKEHMVQVHFGEGLATHTGPEPCVGVSEGVGEASAGECIGQPLSREIVLVPGADVVRKTEGNTHEHAIASARTTRHLTRPMDR